ncbi:phospholipase A1-like [Euwallacea similis]|uniref:phospholipase A1-like n=1 Tax=Euwallacea similis TaxID=1736056 RepID=UPI00344C6868
MKGRTVSLNALTVVTLLHFAFTVSITLPSQTQFLANLFNAATENINLIAAQFKFRTDLSTDDISIIQYLPNGTNTFFVLSDLISGSNTMTLDFGTSIVFIIHGYTESGYFPWVKNMANAYHQIGITNTLAVNWPNPADQNYIGSANATKNVGELVGKWLFDLQTSENFNFSDVHLVGHSLGAHVSGFIGKTIFNLTGGIKVGRISGLDVAAPLFEYPIKVDDADRLSSTDADFVEAYHTNKMLLGYLNPVGSQDFYLNNGGPIQPFCIDIIVTTAMNCSHTFSHKFFTKSITNDKYTSRKCAYNPVGFNYLLCSRNEVVIMGQNNNGTNISGVFYGNTDSNGDPVPIA